MLTAAANLSARALAQVRAHARSNLLSDSTSAELLRLLPATLVAGACLHAIVFHSRRALYLVLSCTVPVYALWSYLGELGFHQAIATRHWTAAALSSGLAALASLAFVMLGIPIAFFLESRFGKALGTSAGYGLADHKPNEPDGRYTFALRRMCFELCVSHVWSDGQLRRLAMRFL